MKKLDILCIEDNEDFCFFMSKAIESMELSLAYDIIMEGEQAIAVLKEESEQFVKPKIILLDLNLHDISGMEILKSIKESNKLSSIPVIILSTSDNPQDVAQALYLGANAFVSKPASFAKLKSFVEDCCNFWLKYNHTSLKTA